MTPLYFIVFFGTFIGLLSSVLALAENTTYPTAYSLQVSPLETNWTKTVGTNPWIEYPRPQLQRAEWLGLNGIWQYQNAAGLDDMKDPPFGKSLERQIMIPSCVESALSGIQGQNAVYSWFSTSFTVPKSWIGQNVVLNFGAVDYEATVFVNGKQAWLNTGGYTSFSVDITAYLSAEGDDIELLVFVHDPTDSDDYVIPIGKQTLRPSHIFYTPCSGIWQSVWVEAVPKTHITKLDLSADMNGQVNATVYSSSNISTQVLISIIDKDRNAIVAACNGTSNKPLIFSLKNPKLWSPTNATLYNITVTMGSDVVSSYTGFRTISRGNIDGVERPLLNSEFVFWLGTLDQGYWPDGIYTPPNRDAMVHDLSVIKGLGFNMVRKHIKVENALFYKACDEIGLLVIQDMPSLRPLQNILPNATQQDEFARQLGVMVDQLKNYPSIVAWVVYNEGWGQVIDGFPEFGLTEMVKSIDPTRLVDSTSGWYDHGAGDFSDNHHYSNPQCGSPFTSLPSSPYDATRIGFQGEFGGIGNNVSIQDLWNNAATIATIDQTYEVDSTLEAWNYRAHLLMSELRDQVEMYACSGAMWTQTTDVEAELNGLMTYDRRVLRFNDMQWKTDIKAIFAAAEMRSATNNCTAAGCGKKKA